MAPNLSAQSDQRMFEGNGSFDPLLLNATTNGDPALPMLSTALVT